jgi:hypothetical protein
MNENHQDLGMMVEGRKLAIAATLGSWSVGNFAGCIPLNYVAINDTFHLRLSAPYIINILREGMASRFKEILRNELWVDLLMRSKLSRFKKNPLLLKRKKGKCAIIFPTKSAKVN